MGLEEPALYDDDLTLARTLVESGDPTLEGVTVERLRQEGWVRLGHPHPLVPFASGFPTPSGRLELYSETAARDGHDPLVGYTPPLEAAGGAAGQRFPLALIAPASHYFLNSMFANRAEMVARAGEPHLTLHPDDAAARRLEEGQLVRVYNDRGSFVARLMVNDRVRPGLAATLKGYWPKLHGTRSNVNATVDERDADMGGGAVYHDNRVEVAAG
jgi:anaerobic selenocysteine-containing dehydrogenase